MRTSEKTVFQFDELAENAKETAREWFRDASSGDSSWSEFSIEDAKRIGALIGFDVDVVFWCGFGSQGDGACWSGSVTYSNGCTANVARECPNDAGIQRIAREWQDLQRRNCYQVRGSVSASYRGMRTSVEAYRSDDRDIVEEGDIDAIVSDFAHWIYRALEQEYECQMSDDQVDESIRANGYEFDEDGRIA